MSSFASTLSTAIAAGRIGLGLALVAAPEEVGRRWVGRTARGRATQVVVRAVGIRDAALGVATLGTLRATGTGGTGFAVLTGLGVVVDLVDATSTWAARDDLPDAETSVAIALGAALGGVAVLATRGSDTDDRDLLEVLDGLEAT